MASIEKQVITAILNMTRARRDSTPVRKSDVGNWDTAAVTPARVREASFSDFSAVARLKQRWGLAADSLENWERLWRRNPAIGHSQVERPIGWVLEAGEQVVGYLGNISLLYRYSGRTLTAVTAHGLVVEPAYRALSLSLVAAFFRQKPVDLYIGTSAIESVGKMARAFKADPVPQADYDTALFWVLKPYCFAYAMMEKLKLATTPAQIGRIVASLAVATDKTLQMRWPKRSSTPFAVSEISIDQIGDDFQTLWIDRLNEGRQLLADRSPAVLRWHFEIPGDRGSVRVLCCRRNDELLGYAVIRDDPEPNGLRRSIVADILAKRDDPEVLKALLVAAYDYASRGGSYSLELLGFPSSVRQICLQWNPYHRKYPACPFYYKAADPILHKTLADGREWYASPFDGDATLIRPSYSSSAYQFNPAAVQTNVVGNDIVLGVSEAERSEVVRP